MSIDGYQNWSEFLLFETILDYKWELAAFNLY